MIENNLVGLVCGVLGILTGIIAIISGTISAIKKRNSEVRLRESIIENHVDAETAKVLVTPETPKTKSPYKTLRWGLALLGIGGGYLTAWVLKLDDMGHLIMMLSGCGIGLLMSFFISSQMDKQKELSQKDNAELSNQI